MLQPMMSLNISIMTFNVEMFNTGSPLAIRDRISAQQADIVLLQEDQHPSQLQQIPGYTKSGECIAANYHKLTNCIWTKDEFMEKHQLSAPRVATFDLVHPNTTNRCAVVAQFEHFSVANLHLAGGRYEDKRFQEGDTPNIMHSKEETLRGLIAQHRPTIIAGDFNGECDGDQALQSLQKYPLYTSLPAAALKSFHYFTISGHSMLRENGYHALYHEDDVCSTSIFNRVVDWVYCDDSAQIEVRNIGTIPCLDISDHNAVKVDLEWKKSSEPQKQPKLL